MLEVQKRLSNLRPTLLGSLAPKNWGQNCNKCSFRNDCNLPPYRYFGSTCSIVRPVSATIELLDPGFGDLVWLLLHIGGLLPVVSIIASEEPWLDVILDALWARSSLSERLELLDIEVNTRPLDGLDIFRFKPDVALFLLLRSRSDMLPARSLNWNVVMINNHVEHLWLINDRNVRTQFFISPFVISRWKNDAFIVRLRWCRIGAKKVKF